MDVTLARGPSSSLWALARFPALPAGKRIQREVSGANASLEVLVADL